MYSHTSADLAVLNGLQFTAQIKSEQAEPLNIERDAVLVRMRQSRLLKRRLHLLFCEQPLPFVDTVPEGMGNKLLKCNIFAFCQIRHFLFRKMHQHGIH